jgi:hypothetical protein
MSSKIGAYKYIIVVILAIVLLNGSYLLGFWQKNDIEVNQSINQSIKDTLSIGNGLDNGSISEDISSIVNKTSANDTIITEESFKQECTRCHNSNITYSGIVRERCRYCHDSSHGLPSGDPSRFEDLGRYTVHIEHGGAISNKGCQSCHGIPACNRCHNGHSGIPDINISKNCVNCHGGLPVPKGHNEERNIFKEGSHKWMGRCNTCHLQSELKFKELATYDRENSSQMCSNCHSKQYKDPSHYKIENGIEKQSCVSCHNPHSPATVAFSLEALSNVKSTLGGMVTYLSEHMGFVALFVLLGLSVIFEYVFRPKKGQVIFSKSLKIEQDKTKARTIKIILSQLFDSSVINQITDILNNNNAKIIGISAGNNEAIIFISRDKKDNDKNIISRIRSISGVSKAEYSKDYESR